jgi:hypothetical protein
MNADKTKSTFGLCFIGVHRRLSAAIIPPALDHASSR